MLHIILTERIYDLSLNAYSVLPCVVWPQQCYTKLNLSDLLDYRKFVTCINIANQ